jgi:hypothetical protein
MATGRKTGGRQKGSVNVATLSTREMKAKAQAMGADILDGLLAMFNDAKQPIEGRIKAGKEILDRGYGKPAQQIKTTSSGSVFDWDKVPNDKLRMVEETLRLAQRDGVVIDYES